MKRKISIFLVLLLLVNICACGNDVPTNVNGNGRVYECDYKTLNLNTKITTIYNGENINISGNIFRLLEDPLTVTNSKGNTLGYAGDAYGIIEQDDHGIYVDGKFEVNMCGNFQLIGDSYKIKDANGNVIANAKFDTFNTSGEIVDVYGNLVATYDSFYFFNDYTVTIYDNNICSDLAILMIMASFVSDFQADSSD